MKPRIFASAAILCFLTSLSAADPTQSSKDAAAPETVKATFLITGLHCPPCTATVEKSVKSIKGVKSVKVDWATKNAKVEYDEKSGNWQFKKGNQKFPIGVTAEGIKKISILDTLLGNKYLNSNSVIFIDEPESALHPAAISKLLDIIAMLAESGIQFFMASHSYFVIKKLFLIAQKNNISIPVFSANNNHWDIANLRDGLPDNPIIDESIHIYKEEVELAFQ